MSNIEQSILEFFQREMAERGPSGTNIVIAPYEVVREFGLELEQDEEDSEVYRVVDWLSGDTAFAHDCIDNTSTTLLQYVRQALSNEGMTLNVVKDSVSELEAKP